MPGLLLFLNLCMAHKISGSKCTVLRKPLTGAPGLLLNDTNLSGREGGRTWGEDR